MKAARGTNRGTNRRQKAHWPGKVKALHHRRAIRGSTASCSHQRRHGGPEGMHQMHCMGSIWLAASQTGTTNHHYSMWLAASQTRTANHHYSMRLAASQTGTAGHEYSRWLAASWTGTAGHKYSTCSHQRRHEGVPQLEHFLDRGLGFRAPSPRPGKGKSQIKCGLSFFMLDSRRVLGGTTGTNGAGIR